MKKAFFLLNLFKVSFNFSLDNRTSCKDSVTLKLFFNCFHMNNCIRHQKKRFFRVSNSCWIHKTAIPPINRRHFLAQTFLLAFSLPVEAINFLCTSDDSLMLSHYPQNAHKFEYFTICIILNFNSKKLFFLVFFRSFFTMLIRTLCNQNWSWLLFFFDENKKKKSFRCFSDSKHDINCYLSCIHTARDGTQRAAFEMHC